MNSIANTMSPLRTSDNRADDAPASHTASAHAKARIRSTLEFLEMLNKWYEDMKQLPYPLVLALLRMGGRVQRFLKRAA